MTARRDADPYDCYTSPGVRPSPVVESVAALVRLAGADGVTRAGLTAQVRPSTGPGRRRVTDVVASALATATERYPQMYECDAGRLYWAPCVADDGARDSAPDARGE